MKAGDIIAVIEEFAPLSIQESWDNSGLLLGSADQEITGVLVALDCTEEVVREAVARGCNMILTHHPLIFRGLKRISPQDPVGAAVIAAVKEGVCVYASHTPSDKVPAGVSGAMAAKLSLQDVQILEEEEGETGLGCTGYFPVPMTAADALVCVKEAFGLKIIRHSRPVEGLIHKVAVLGGSGGGDIDAAIKAGAQLFISADISYHNFFTPEGFMIMDIGHFESEVEIVDIFLSKIRKKFPTFASYKSDVLDGSNPVRYFGM